MTTLTPDALRWYAEHAEREELADLTQPEVASILREAASRIIELERELEKQIGYRRDDFDEVARLQEELAKARVLPREAA